MILTELNLMESRNINIKQLDSIIKKSKKPVYVVVAGSVGFLIIFF